MEESQQEKKPHPRATANCLSVLTFWWTWPLFVLGNRRELEISDLCEPLKEHHSARLGDLLESKWEGELQRCRGRQGATPSLVRAICGAFGLQFLAFAVVLVFMDAVIKLVQPLMLGVLLRYFSPGSEMLLSEAMWAALGVAGCSLLGVLVAHPYIMGVMHLGMQIRVAACSLVYRKALRLSASAITGGASAGKVVNLMSNDVARFDWLPLFLHEAWLAPVELLVCCYLMWREMGAAAMLGVTTLLLTIPLQLWLGRKMGHFRTKTAARTDERVRLMNEILSGIRVIKMYAWENAFAKLVAVARRTEIRTIRWSAYIRGVNLSLTMFTTRVTVFITLLAFVLLGHSISPEKVFVMMSFYSIIRQAMVMFFPKAIEQIAESLVSIRRIQAFLLLDEVPERMVPQKVDDHNEEASSVSLQQVTAQWVREAATPTLSDVTLTLHPGRLVMVIGTVGAGKSSLLQAVLGELPLVSGQRQVRGRISYAAQEPWIFAGTLRQNVMFGQPWDPVRFKRVIRACALERDLSLMPDGDLTLVGERGVTLSGGQRARVSLARAVYREADIYVLDDPLSAVDAHVSRHLVEECVLGLLRERSVLLATHQLQFLPHAAHIVVLDNGRVETAGSYSELQAREGLDLSQLLDEEDNSLHERQNSTSSLQRLVRQISITSSISSASSLVKEGLSEALESDTAGAQVAETRSSGAVSGRVYASYLRAGGGFWRASGILALCFIAQLAGSGVDLWVTFWTNLEESRTSLELLDHPVYETAVSNSSSPVEIWVWPDTTSCVLVYAALVVALIGFALLRSALFARGSMRASTQLHDSMFSAVTRATMPFFTNNPAGRILNRFSRDMGAVDEMLPQALVDAIQIGLSMLGTIAVVALVNVWMLLPTAAMALLFYAMRAGYLATARSLKRLEGVTRSPVFTHLAASVSGLPTIRAFQAERLLVQQFDQHQDLNSTAWYLFVATSRAFGYWLDVMCAIYIAAVTLAFLAMTKGGVAGGDVGLAITQAVGLTGMIQWGVRQSAEVENHMTAVERVLEFSELEPEPPLQTAPERQPPPGWPQQGEIEFQAVTIVYPPSEVHALDGVSFRVLPGEKVGVVGRTGAGKSSLISALFRLAEMPVGRVLLDGVDSASLGLHQLRSAISIIPQEPVLFSGTMRKNLDPFDQHTDEELWRALRDVELWEVVHDLSSGLYAHLAEGGGNLSVGQRQLVCLARAVLRNNRILVLDEATANVDQKTDSLIQQTIRRKFASCTVLTIAHRLNTVMDSDRVLVMDAGRVREFDTPARLLTNSRSLFTKMVRQQTRNREM